ncbi:hypothetical protein [Paenibacillus sp. SI8]|uniref:hypothetical protein n=1 Tax=unclassified Paenibacillus TaxID=185978 RepID=UPI003465C670
MKPSLKLTSKRSSSIILRSVVFLFPRIGSGVTVFSGAFRLRNVVNFGEIIISQRPSAGFLTQPVIRYQIVDAVTHRPITNAVTVRGTRTFVLTFVVPAGTDRLQITNVGPSPAEVNGKVLIF